MGSHIWADSMEGKKPVCLSLELLCLYISTARNLAACGALRHCIVLYSEVWEIWSLTSTNSLSIYRILFQLSQTTYICSLLQMLKLITTNGSPYHDHCRKPLRCLILIGHMPIQNRQNQHKCGKNCRFYMMLASHIKECIQICQRLKHILAQLMLTT